MSQRTIVTCDHCGEETAVPLDRGKPVMPPGWVEVLRDRYFHLCPACSDAYRGMKKRHESEVRVYLGLGQPSEREQEVWGWG